MRGDVEMSAKNMIFFSSSCPCSDEDFKVNEKDEASGSEDNSDSDKDDDDSDDDDTGRLSESNFECNKLLSKYWARMLRVCFAELFSPRHYSVSKCLFSWLASICPSPSNIRFYYLVKKFIASSN